MTYEEIKLSFLKGGIRSYKVFQGHKLYSHTVASENNQRLISKRVYLTKKRHYVYYERTDVNWNYWDKGKEDSSFDPNQVEENNVFEIADDLKTFAKYLDKDIVEKLADKVQHGEIVEYLDI
ncbi:EXLDI protein [Streptococcus mutans]|uniref:EXLDI protein n=1 Tax=Streptococcus mutans TaxID=1309 RepID=UPI0028F0E90B|nr:EXLDI protein [Streptococcus mutans]MDT9493645.1 EXLDI protein [Streptococcus mutans]